MVIKEVFILEITLPSHKTNEQHNEVFFQIFILQEEINGTKIFRACKWYFRTDKAVQCPMYLMEREEH